MNHFREHDRATADPVVGHAFSHGFNHDHVHRIAAYWAQAWAGPSVYTDTMSFATWSGVKGI